MKIQVWGFSQKNRMPGNAEPTSPHSGHWLELRACPLQRGQVTSHPAVGPGALGVCGPRFGACFLAVARSRSTHGTEPFPLLSLTLGAGCPLHLTKRTSFLVGLSFFPPLYVHLGVQGQNQASTPFQIQVLSYRARPSHSWLSPDVL